MPGLPRSGWSPVWPPSPSISSPPRIANKVGAGSHTCETLCPWEPLCFPSSLRAECSPLPSLSYLFCFLSACPL